MAFQREFCQELLAFQRELVLKPSGLGLYQKAKALTGSVCIVRCIIAYSNIGNIFITGQLKVLYRFGTRDNAVLKSRFVVADAFKSTTVPRM